MFFLLLLPFLALRVPLTSLLAAADSENLVDPKAEGKPPWAPMRALVISTYALLVCPPPTLETTQGQILRFSANSDSNATSRR